MFELANFYDYCKSNQVDVIPYCGIPHPGATIRDGTLYGGFSGFFSNSICKALRGVCCHEQGHIATGALHKVDSPYELVERSEYRANRYVARTYLTREDFMEAFEAGYRELWQLAEYFDLPEADIQKAYTYWAERQQVDFGCS